MPVDAEGEATASAPTRRLELVVVKGTSISCPEAGTNGGLIDKQMW